MPQVWPVIATRQRPEWLERQLHLLVPQLQEQERIVVVIDHCDRTAQLVRSMDAAAKVVCVILGRQVGPDIAKRIGIAQVPADAVVCEIDDHDLAEPELLAELRKAFADPGVYTAYCDCRVKHVARGSQADRVEEEFNRAMADEVLALEAAQDAFIAGKALEAREKADGRYCATGNLGYGMRAYRKWACDLVGGYPQAWFPANDYALLCMIEQLAPDSARHIRMPLVTALDDPAGVSARNGELQREMVVKVANLGLANAFRLPYAAAEARPATQSGRAKLAPIRHIQPVLTTCVRNRLEHLKKTIPAALASNVWFVIVVDYGSTDGGLGYLRSIEDDRLVVVECLGAADAGWHYSKAQNTGVRVAASLGANAVGIFDCDVALSPRWAEDCARKLAKPDTACVRVNQREYKRRGLRGLGGTNMVRVDLFAQVMGYDEQMDLWGWQDTDLLMRMERFGQRAEYDVDLVEHQDHPDALRGDKSRADRHRAMMLGRTDPRANPGKRRLRELGWGQVRIHGQGRPRQYGDCGVVYAADGGRYVRQARHSILSLHLWCPGLPVATVGFDAPDSRRVPDEAAGEGRWGARLWKLRAHELSPFARTIYLDSDTVICGDLAEAFGLLGDYDILLTHDPSSDFEGDFHLSAEDRELTRSAAGHAWPQFNGGMLAFGRTEMVGQFFDAWRAEWEREGFKDQGALTRALIRTRPRLFVLGRHWDGPRDGSIVWHRFCEGLRRPDGRMGVVRDEADLYERTAGMSYVRGRA